MKLPDRLAAMAACINSGETVADIGTDHGLLPIFLLKNRISPKVILSDINPGPLEMARNNLHIYAQIEDAELRLGNGISNIENGEVDVVVIGGMGGLLIADIMAADETKTKSLKKFVLQPRNNQEKLRIWLYKNNYTITDEVLVKEGNYICEIIVVDTSAPKENAEKQALFEKKLSALEFEISPLLFSKKDPLLKELIECRINTEEKIMHSIRKNGSKNSLTKISGIETRIEKLNVLKKRAGQRL